MLTLKKPTLFYYVWHCAVTIYKILDLGHSQKRGICVQLVQKTAQHLKNSRNQYDNASMRKVMKLFILQS